MWNNNKPARARAAVNGHAKDHRLPLGNDGEREAAQRLAARGHKILFFKPDLNATNYRGFDIVTFKKNRQGGHVYFIDNKASTRSGVVYSASAITRNFATNLEQFKIFLGRMKGNLNRSPEERTLISQALAAIEAGRMVRVVTNATMTSAPATGVSPALARQKIKFWNVQNW